MQFPALFQKGEAGYVVSFRDIPEAITQGDNYDHAVKMALDALLTSFSFYREDKRFIPKPSKAQEGEVLIHIPASAVAKILLVNTITDKRITQVKLADLMGVSSQYLTRLVDMTHTTKIDTIEKALNAMGVELSITTTDIVEA